MEFMKLNVNMDMIVKNATLTQWDTKITTDSLNTEMLKII